jgi:hypothetical protein
MLVLRTSHVAAVDGTILRLHGAEDTAVQRLHELRQAWCNEVVMNTQRPLPFLDGVAVVYRVTIQNQVNVVSVRVLREASDEMEPQQHCLHRHPPGCAVT